MATFTDKLLVRSSTGNRNALATDLIVSGSDWSIANLVIPGDLEVQGTTTTVNSDNLNIADAGILLSSTYTSTTARDTGIATVISGTVTVDTVATGGFATAQTVITTGSGTFAAGDIVLVTNANNAANDGIYEVVTHTGTTLTVANAAGKQETWLADTFTVDTTVAGNITKVNVSAIQANGTTGLWETGTGATVPISYSTVGTGSGNGLTAAYDVNSTLLTDGANGTFLVSGDQKMQITATGGLDLDSFLDADVSSFDVLSSGAISLDAVSPSNFTVDNSTLAIATTTAGTLSLNSAGALDLDAAGAGTVDASSITLTSSFGVIALNANTDIDIDGQNVVIDGTQSSNLTITANEATTQTLTLAATNAGAGGANILIDATDTVDVNAGTFDLDVVTAAQINGPTITASATLAATFESSGTGSTTIDAGSGGLDLLSDTGVEITATSGTVDINATSSVTIDASAGGISLDGAGTSNFTTSSGNLSVSANAGSVTLNSSTATQVNAGTFDVNSTNAVTIDSSAAGFSIDGVTASNITTTTGNLTLSTTTGGDIEMNAGFSGSVNITSSGASTYTVPNNNAAAWTLTDGGDSFIIADSTSGAEQLKLGQFTNFQGGAGIEITTTDALVEGNIVYINASGEAALVDADAGTLREGMVFGISTGTFSAAAVARIVTVPGVLVPIRMVSAPAGSLNGTPIYGSTTAGQCTTTGPTGDSEVQFMVGILQGADGADTTPLCLFSPQRISEGGSVTVT